MENIINLSPNSRYSSQERHKLYVAMNTDGQRLTQFNELHGMSDPMKYIIIFPYGNYGYCKSLKKFSKKTNRFTNKSISILDYQK